MESVVNRLNEAEAEVQRLLTEFEALQVGRMTRAGIYHNIQIYVDMVIDFS